MHYTAHTRYDKVVAGHSRSSFYRWNIQGNREYFAMCVLMVEDGNGLPQVVEVAWLASEKESTSAHLVQQLQRADGDIFKEIKVIMLDKDFVEIKICKAEFANAL